MQQLPPANRSRPQARYTSVTHRPTSLRRAGALGQCRNRAPVPVSGCLCMPNHHISLRHETKLRTSNVSPACSTPAVTKRRNSWKRCNSANNGRKPQKAQSKTECRPTSADQQHRTEAHEQGPKQLATARSTQRAQERRKQSNTQHPMRL